MENTHVSNVTLISLYYPTLFLTPRRIATQQTSLKKLKLLRYTYQEVPYDDAPIYMIDTLLIIPLN